MEQTPKPLQRSGAFAPLLRIKAVPLLSQKRVLDKFGLSSYTKHRKGAAGTRSALKD